MSTQGSAQMEMEIGGGTQVVDDGVAQWKNGHVIARAGTRGGSHPVGRFWRRIRPRASSRGGGGGSTMRAATKVAAAPLVPPRRRTAPR